MKLLLPFLFLIFTLPAAAQTLNGRLVRSDNFEQPIRNSIVRLTDPTTGEIRYTAVNQFGYFKFPGIVYGRSYNLDVSSKQYLFGRTSVAIFVEGAGFWLVGHRRAGF